MLQTSAAPPAPNTQTGKCKPTQPLLPRRAHSKSNAEGWGLILAPSWRHSAVESGGGPPPAGPPAGRGAGPRQAFRLPASPSLASRPPSRHGATRGAPAPRLSPLDLTPSLVLPQSPRPRPPRQDRTLPAAPWGTCREKRPDPEHGPSCSEAPSVAWGQRTAVAFLAGPRRHQLSASPRR